MSNRALKTQTLAHRSASVCSAEQSAPLQLGNDQIHKVVQYGWQHLGEVEPRSSLGRWGLGCAPILSCELSCQQLFDTSRLLELELKWGVALAA